MDGLVRLQEQLSTEEFDCIHFIDMQVHKAIRESSSPQSASFDPAQLTECFEKSIMQLDELSEALEKDQSSLVARAKTEEAACRQEVASICSTLDEVRDRFESLDSRITAVSHKVGHLGDQLESANAPRERLAEMEKLLRFLSDFVQESSSSFSLKSHSHELHESAKIAHKLNEICKEFPDNGDFLTTKQKIFQQYSEVDRFLFKEFESAFVAKEYDYCYEMAGLMSAFNSYDRCKELFVDENIKYLPFSSADVFSELRQAVAKAYQLARQIFPSPEPVMSAYIQAVFSKKIKILISNQLVKIDGNDKVVFLKKLESMFTECNAACDKLSDFQLGVDLSKQTASIFSHYLFAYFTVEYENVSTRCQQILDHYYEAQGHVRRKEVLQQNSRVLQLFTGVSEEQGAGRVLLCDALVANILSEVTQSCQRCRTLSPQVNLSKNVYQLAEVFFKFIYDEHLTYGLHLAALGLPQASEPSQRPSLNFFEAVREANMIFHLCEGKFNEILLPALKSAPGGATPELARVLERRRAIANSLESFIQQGLERCLSAIVGHVRHLLNSEQKPTDFKLNASGEAAEAISGGASRACAEVCSYISGHVLPKLSCLDGKNGQLMREELSLRLYRCLVEHLYKFEYSLSGGFQAVCDLTEYMSCMRPIHPTASIVDGVDLYDLLYKIINLLVIPAANLHDICEEESLRCLSREVKHSFIQLRTDHRSAEVRTALEKI